jgi:hypothetical protein
MKSRVMKIIESPLTIPRHCPNRYRVIYSS